MRTLSFLILLISLVFLSACGVDDRAENITALQGDSAAGKTLFDINCSGCHGTDGRGGTYNISVVFARRFKRDESIADTIITGDGDMPPYGEMWTDQQIADVLAYIHEL